MHCGIANPCPLTSRQNHVCQSHRSFTPSHSHGRLRRHRWEPTRHNSHNSRPADRPGLSGHTAHDCQITVKSRLKPSPNKRRPSIPLQKPTFPAVNIVTKCVQYRNHKSVRNLIRITFTDCEETRLLYSTSLGLDFSQLTCQAATLSWGKWFSDVLVCFTPKNKYVWWSGWNAIVGRRTVTNTFCFSCVLLLSLRYSY